MKLMFSALLIFSACSYRTPEVRVFTAEELTYLDSLTLEKRVYMKGCMERYRSYMLNNCIQDFYYDTRQVSGFGNQKDQNQGQSVGKTAVGTALGYGAAKLILGR